MSDGPDTGARNSKSIVTSGDERSVPCVPLGRGGNRCFATSPVLAVGVAQPTPIARDGGGATVTACVSNSDRRTGNADRISVVSDLPCDSLSSPATIRYTAVCIRFRYSCWLSYANGQTPVTESLPLWAIGRKLFDSLSFNREYCYQEKTVGNFCRVGLCGLARPSRTEARSKLTTLQCGGYSAMTQPALCRLDCPS